MTILTFFFNNCLALPYSSLKFGRDVTALKLLDNSYNKVHYDVFYIALNKYEPFHKVLVYLRNPIGSVVIDLLLLPLFVISAKGSWVSL